MHRQKRVIHAGRELQVARGQSMAFGKKPVAGPKIESPRTHVAAERCGLLHFDNVAVTRGQFLDHHRVGGLRQHAAGKDTRGLARRRSPPQTAGQPRPRR